MSTMFSHDGGKSWRPYRTEVLRGGDETMSDETEAWRGRAVKAEAAIARVREELKRIDEACLDESWWYIDRINFALAERLVDK